MTYNSISVKALNGKQEKHFNLNYPEMEVNGKIEETGMDNKQKPKAAGQHWGS